MALVSLAQNSQDHKQTVNVAQTFAPEMNSFMNGDIAYHAHQVKYMTEVQESAQVVATSLLTSSQLNVVIVNTDHLMVLNASNAQITLVPRTKTLNVLEINAKITKFKMLMELAQNAQRVQDQTSCKGTVSKLSAIQAAHIDKSMLKL